MSVSNRSESALRQRPRKELRKQVKTLISRQEWPCTVFEQLGGKLDDGPSEGTVIGRDAALNILGLTIDQAVEVWLTQFFATLWDRVDNLKSGAAFGKTPMALYRESLYVDTSTDPFIGETWGKNQHSALIFMDYADHIWREEGIDVYERKAQMEANNSSLRRIIKQMRKDKTYADESILDEIEVEMLRYSGALTKEEQQAKDEWNLAKARAVKDDLRKSGMSDAPRFGFCKRTRCPNRKIERLLVRGFCPDCRGLEVYQEKQAGHRRADATSLNFADARTEGERISIRVVHNQKAIQPEVLKMTREERREKVLTAKNINPQASIRDIVRLTGVPRATVSDILNNKVGRNAVKTPDSGRFLNGESRQIELRPTTLSIKRNTQS